MGCRNTADWLCFARGQTSETEKVRTLHEPGARLVLAGKARACVQESGFSAPTAKAVSDGEGYVLVK